MGLFRLILLGLVIWLLFRLYQRFIKGRSSQQQKTHQIEDNMVRCKHCGIHVPEKEALKKNNHYYCSQAHLEDDTR
ncbi:MAG: PP0621 family protein [Gammaproteobacteria bacterium]|nr:PP0621 family protein [Gammaproteobacteria bacterium]MDH5594508.1 PP0621 family protein [Gammaproteobacteria bacterium]